MQMAYHARSGVLTRLLGLLSVIALHMSDKIRLFFRRSLTASGRKAKVEENKWMTLWFSEMKKELVATTGAKLRIL